jgi:two-component system chemotaxis sensor kinase CheA
MTGESYDMDDLLRDFLTESTENLTRLDREIVELEREPANLELLKSIFRTIHTIKGTCGFLDLSRLESVAHSAENVLGLLRDGQLDVSAAIISDVLAAVDVIKLILDGLERHGAEPAGDDAALIGRLDGWTTGHEKEEVSADELLFPVPIRPAAVVPAEASTAPRKRTSKRASATKAPKEKAPRSRAKAEKAGRTESVADTSPAAEVGPGAPAQASSAADAGAPDSRSAIADSSLRVNVSILDLLMNLAGELVLTRNQLNQLSQADEHSELRMPLQHLHRVTSDLQEAVMRTRMQPIGNAWGKLPRLVRDLCQASGKKIELEMTGAETELDRQVLQAIGDPLTHMIRNSADHGIETPEVRSAAGKPERGTIKLAAFHEGGHIIIEIRDDGKGLNVEAIRQKAVERGLVRADVAATLSDSQVFRYIFEPGFSTAEKITNVSGRGVGMDVVRSNIEGIGGSIELSSIPRRGTTFRIKIPLTLAILSALIVGTTGQSFAIPQIGVVELVRIGEDNRNLVEQVNGSLFYRLRETLLPLLRLNDVLRLPDSGSDEQSIVVCQVGTQRFGVVVDEIFDTHEIVVKPIGRMVKSVPFYSGTTILGDGRVIMILDVPTIATLTNADDHAEKENSNGAGSEAATTAEGEDRLSLVVFRSGGEAPQAVPLALVSRLEKIPAADIEIADGRWLVQYRGSLLPVVSASPYIDIRAVDPRPIIVFTDGERSMGLAVDEIQDIVEDRLQVEITSSVPGVIGTAVIAGKSTEVLDINHFLRIANPNWFRAQAEVSVRRRVLLVDDSPFFLSLVGPVLSSSNYEVSMAKDGREALARLERGDRFDVIVTDIDMPHVDGFELARRIRQNPAWHDVPLLALTGRSAQADRDHGFEVGFRQFLQKFDRDAVLAAVHAAIDVSADEEITV